MYTDAERRDKIGQILEEIRKSVNVSQSDLCNGIGIARSTWRSWTSGLTMPSVEMMYKIFRFLNYPIVMALSKYSNINITDFSEENPVVLKNQIKDIIKNNFTDLEKVLVNNIISGTDQEIHLIIEISVAHVLSELSGRYKIATQTYDDYLIVDHNKKYARPNITKLDLESLRQAIVLGKQAHFENAYAYSFENHTSGNLGSMIAELREANNKTQEDLAKMMGVGKPTIRNWENNTTPMCIDELLKLLELFNEPIGLFMSYYTYPYSKLTENQELVIKSEEELFTKIDNISNVLTLIHLKFLSLGTYGSRYNLVQLTSAYLQLPLKDRQRNVNMIILNYREAEQHKSIRYIYIPHPDILLLERAREAGRYAYLSGKTTYTI